MPQYSMTGTPFEARNPMGSDQDVERRKVAGKLSGLIYDNPALNKKAMSGVAFQLGGGLPYDNEGLLNAYAMKYGQDAALSLLEALPTMNRQDLIAIEKDVSGAAKESMDTDRREMGRRRN